MAVPTLIQATTSAGSPETWSDLNYNLPHPALGGNCLILWYQTGAAAGSPTITDDGSGNVWTQMDLSVTGGQFLYLYICPNVSAGTQQVRVQFGSALNFFQGGVYEFNNIATTTPKDTSNNNNGSSTTPSVSLTTGTAGDLIFMVFIQNTVAMDAWFGTSITADANGELIHGDLWSGSGSYWAVQAGSGAVTPTITIAPSAGWQAVAVALKSAAAGKPLPAGVRVRRRQFSSMLQTSITSRVLQQPCANGSCVVYSMHSWKNDSNDHSVNGIVDQGNNNLFLAAAASHVSAAARFDSAIWYSPFASPVTPYATVTWTNPVDEATAATYELVGHDQTNPVGSTYSNSGNQTVAGDLTAGIITPLRDGSIVIAVLPIDTGTVIGSTSPSNRAYDGFYSTGMDSGFNQLEEDNGHGHYLGPTKAQQTWIWTLTNKAVAVGNWDVTLAEFMPPGPLYKEYNIGKVTAVVGGNSLLINS